MDMKELRPGIETRLARLMKERGWEGGDTSWYTTYRKDGISLDVKVDSVGDFRCTGFQIVFYSYKQYNCRFKVNIAKGNLTARSYTIDEKKLDKKIEEVSAILRGRDEAYREREKRQEENEKKAVEFAAEVGNLLPGYRVEAISPRTANLFVDSESFISVTKVQPYMFHLAIKHPLIAGERNLPGLIKTLAEHS